MRKKVSLCGKCVSCVMILNAAHFYVELCQRSTSIVVTAFDFSSPIRVFTLILFQEPDNETRLW